MFYKHNSFSGRIAASEAQTTYHPEGFRSLKPTSATKVLESTSVTQGGNILSQILKFQNLFQKGDAPVYLAKGGKDLITYRGAMIGSLIGLSFTFFTLGQMAVGRMKKK